MQLGVLASKDVVSLVCDGPCDEQGSADGTPEDRAAGLGWKEAEGPLACMRKRVGGNERVLGLICPDELGSGANALRSSRPADAGDMAGRREWDVGTERPSTG